ncbi:MAG: FHA domain-containing protein [Myxococcales bacterium]|jgi:hypothetical protein|nr:FHA domain-containing protein [Myxococcales bacterium]
MTTLTSSKKTLQSFHARDSLWEAFQRQAEAMECSVDYLVNEAMRLYASNQGFLEATGMTAQPAPMPAMPMPSADARGTSTDELSLDDLDEELPDLGDDLPSLDDDLPSLDDDLPSLDDDLPSLDDLDDSPAPAALPRPPRPGFTPPSSSDIPGPPVPAPPAVAAPLMPGGGPPVPAPPAVAAPLMPGGGPPVPAPPAVASPPVPSETAPTIAEPPVPAPPKVIRPSARVDSNPIMPMAPRPPAATRTPGPGMVGSGVTARPVTGSGVVPAAPVPGAPASQAPPLGMPRLTLVYLGQKIPVNKEQFIIGRGSSSTDLTVRDPNISRKHAAVIFHNNTFYIKDLGSTNGVEYIGQRIDSKRIDEGDVFTICGHQFHFTYA